MVGLVVLRQTAFRVDKNLTLGVALEVRTDDRTEVLTDNGCNLNVTLCSLLEFEEVHAVDKLLHLVAVLCEVEVQVPREVLCLYRTCAELNFNTVVVNLTGVDETVGVTGSPRRCHAHNLILTRLTVVCHVEADFYNTMDQRVPKDYKGIVISKKRKFIRR